MRYFLFGLYLWLGMSSRPAGAQAPAVLRGRVLDAETHQAIPNAQVGVAGNRIGTSTNDDGRFVLIIPLEYQREQLEVALIGYRKYARPLPPLPGPELRVELQISPSELGEVRVTASVEGIVREAVVRIPQNYPAWPTRLTGFYRESDNDPDGRPRYLVEGVLTVFKVPYRKRSDQGDVQIQQSRKVDLRPYESVRTDWAGGPFIAHKGDFVHGRAQFIDPAHFRDYVYGLDAATSYQNRRVYVVTFGPRPGNRRADFAGRMFIDQDSYAFLGAEWHCTPAGLRHGSYPADARALRVAFQPYAGRWHLKTVWWQTKYRPPHDELFTYFGEFLTTAIDTARAPAPTYVQRAQVHDVFLANPVPYDSAFWQSSTTLLPPAALRQALLDQQRQRRADSLFRLPPPTAEPVAVAAPEKPRFELARRLRYGGAGGLLPLAVPGAGLALDYAPAGYSFRASGTVGLSPQTLIGQYSYEYEFDLTPALAVHLATRTVFRQFTGDGWEAGLSYQRNLNPRHRPLFARAGLHYTRQTVARTIDTFANSDAGLRVAGTRLNADELSLQVQSRTAALLPKLGLGLELSRRLELVADLGYLLPLNTRTQLQVSEASGFFLSRSSATLDLPHPDVHLRVNGLPAAAAPWQLNRWLLSFGFLYRMR